MEHQTGKHNPAQTGHAIGKTSLRATWRLKTGGLPMSSWHGVLKELAQILKTLKHMQQKNSYRLIYTCYSAVKFEYLHRVPEDKHREKECQKFNIHYSVYYKDNQQ